MALTPGTRIGPYEVGGLLGTGGMGEVYQATDTNLKRAVALKVLPTGLAGDPDRLARFQREAEVLASLNHPNIAQIHGLEKSGGTTALVMELVEGPTLADRIAEGAIPIDDALPIAKQIADALEAAHEQGIVHRDLKPANVKVRPDGMVKVLDFGLAKAMEPAGAMSVSASMSPTITTPALMTGAGMILGTAAYMSPEQARGKPVDRRADIWAFGCVLFEMLTGERLFKGEDVGQTLAAVIMAEPSLDAAPAHLRPLLKSCLEKDPRKRLRDIGDIGLLLDRPAQPAQAPQELAPPRRAAWLWPAVAALLLATAAGFAFLYLRQPPPAQQSLRFQIPPPGDTPAQMFTLSPDGTQLAFVAADEGPSRLWVRAMDALDARALAGTDGATYPFWSPDGQSLGFFADGKLKKIAVAGGPPQTLCDASSGRGGSWSREGVIVFSAGPSSPILRVSSAGGEATPITQVSGTGGHRFPAFLPGERRFLFNSGSDDPAAVGLYVGSLDGAVPARLLPDTSNAIYAPPVEPGGAGFVLFRRGDTLMAQPLGPSDFSTAGEMFPVAEQVAQGSGHNGFGAFSVASIGVLAYRTGAAATRELWWVDRTGKRLGSATRPAGIGLRYGLSPDEKTVAMQVSSGAGPSDMWLQDLERGVFTRFTFRNAIVNNPVWSPDGSRVVFSVTDESLYSAALFQKATIGSASEELLLSTGVNGRATDWSSDGKVIAYSQQDSNVDIWLLPLEGDRKPVAYQQGPSNEQNGRFYPGSEGAPRFMAYQSDESGQNQIYLQAIPAAAKFQVSTEGGTVPQWRRDGRELYYLSADNRLMAVPITIAASVQIGTPQELFMNASMTAYVPSRDGQRFLVNLPAGGESASGAEPITVVTNWQAGRAR